LSNSFTLEIHNLKPTRRSRSNHSAPLARVEPILLARFVGDAPLALLIVIVIILVGVRAYGKPIRQAHSIGKSSSEEKARVDAGIVDRILATARDSVGKQMWKVGFGLPEGRLGCAASVSNVLKKSGIKGVYSPVTKRMREQILKGALPVIELVLKDGGDSPIDHGKVAHVAKPGDVVVAFMHPLPGADVGPNAHCGVIGPDGTVYTNDWNNGIWSQGNIHTFFDSYRYIRLLRFK
ncbi:MAG: hypothetical protein K2Z81_22055, partial [Cyanobacteria bacterium]|nr:hypothetical protein [Cyanobacteriota bacterium]